MDSGVATRPIADFEEYRDQLVALRVRSGPTMEPVFAAAQARRPSASSTPRARTSACCAPRRRPSTRASRVRCWSVAPTSSRAASRQLGLRLTLGENCDGVNILDDPRFRDCWPRVLPARTAQGRHAAQAQEDMRTRPTLVAAMLVHRGDADACCAAPGQFAGPPALRPQRDRHARRREDARGACRC